LPAASKTDAPARSGGVDPGAGQIPEIGQHSMFARQRSKDADAGALARATDSKGKANASSVGTWWSAPSGYLELK